MCRVFCDIGVLRWQSQPVSNRCLRRERAEPRVFQVLHFTGKRGHLVNIIDEGIVTK